MKNKIFIISSVILLLSGCYETTIDFCILENKKVTVFNNTGYEIQVKTNEPPYISYGEKVLATLRPFEFKEFTIPYDATIKAGIDDGNVFIMSELYTEQCKRSYELIVDN